MIYFDAINLTQSVLIISIEIKLRAKSVDYSKRRIRRWQNSVGEVHDALLRQRGRLIGRDADREESSRVEPDNGGVRKRENHSQRQLVALRKVHSDRLQPVASHRRRQHEDLSARKVARRFSGSTRAQLSHLLSALFAVQFQGLFLSETS